MPISTPVLFQSVKHFIFDVDGVLTDGTIYVMPGGEQVRRMNIKDGYALQLAKRKGYSITVVSGSDRSAVADRLSKLGINDVFFSVTDKPSFVSSIIKEKGWSSDQVLYMGDDIPDLAVMSLVGLPAAPKDAAPEILSAAKYISPLTGGMGCVRDVIEQVLRLNDHWQFETGITSR